MRRLPSRARRRIAVALVHAVLFSGFAAFAPSFALAGDGVSAPLRAGASRVVPLASGVSPIFGAPPEDPAHAEATFVYLHGVCGLTTNGCGHFEGAPGWLVCPQANHACANGGSSWAGSIADKTAIIDAALDAAHAQWPASTTAPVVLVGFSQGAYVAMDLARAQPGRYAGMLLLGADTTHGLDALRAARVRRIGFVCGVYDMMFPKMRATPGALARWGIEARFDSLGAVGHTYGASDGTDDVLTAMLTWVADGAGDGVAAEPLVRAID